MTITVIRNADVVVAWDAQAARHVYLRGADVAFEDGTLRHVGSRYEGQADEPVDGAGRMVMPGLVNAHQHGRGLSQIQLGNVDDFLETWIAGRRAGSPIDSGAVARLAAASMLANGVTTTVHGNYAYGTGNYEQEVRDQIAAYASAGLRLTMSIGAMDRGQIVYPPHEACFMAGLPADVKDWLSRPGNAPYCKDVASTIELMHRLRADFANEPLVRFCYGPAGPQWVSDRTWSLLAEDADGVALGFCQLYPSFCSVIAAPIYVLYDLFVAPRARKSGAGRALLRQAEAHVRAGGYARMDLTTARTNLPAQALYESLGWEQDQVFLTYNRHLAAQAE